ncbi:MAG: PAS domain S-box protein [Deltaproteobacteria bacterium]|nr:PAS domain S-box protein [Deltaproteobacteria bacterium]
MEMNVSVLKEIFASMEQGVVFIDDQNRIAYFNPAAEKIRDTSLHEMLGQSILNCHPKKSHSKVMKIIENLRSGKIKGHQRMNLQLVKGKFYDNTYSAVWGPENQYLGVIVVTREVTERKKAEEELKEALVNLRLANEELVRLDRMKDNFLSNVSHELKTPMISVMGYLGMILKEKVGSLTETQKRFLEISHKNLLKLEKNIDNLLDLAELGIRKEVFTFEPIDLVKVIQFSCSTVAPLAKEYQIEVGTTLPEEPLMIEGVADKLDQLFDNLLTNAIKYNHRSGKIDITLTENDRFVFTHIMNTGLGISHQSLSEVFTRHFQEKKKPLGDVKGLGIGLSLVQEIVKLHHGEVQIESEEGKGTVFSVMLPKKINSSEFGVKSSEI